MRGLTGAAPGNFSVFMLRQQLGNAWCCGSKTHSYCGTPASSRMLLHGLWPQWGDASLPQYGWPQYCGSFAPCAADASLALCQVPASVRAKFGPQWSAVAPDYIQWSDPKCSFRSNGCNYANHEWMKHGSCTKLGMQGYFAEGVRLMQALPAATIVAGSKGGTVTLRRLQQAYAVPGLGDPAGGSVALACRTDGTLYAVSTCYSVTVGGQAGARVNCPALSVMASGYSNGCAVRKLSAVRIAARDTCPGGRSAATVAAVAAAEAAGTSRKLNSMREIERAGLLVFAAAGVGLALLRRRAAAKLAVVWRDEMQADML